jgi:serine/threonine-protein kinase RsbW
LASPAEPSRLILDLHVPATEAGMDEVHAALDGCWETLELSQRLGDRWRAEFALAVAEVAANIIQHAHAPEPPLVQFDLSLTQFPDRLVGRFSDRGVQVAAKDHYDMPSVEGAYDTLGERGRGLALVQATTDRFEYRRLANNENVWIIEKDFPRHAAG